MQKIEIRPGLSALGALRLAILGGGNGELNLVDIIFVCVFIGKLKLGVVRDQRKLILRGGLVLPGGLVDGGDLVYSSILVGVLVSVGHDAGFIFVLDLDRSHKGFVRASNSIGI